jgi:DNA topoisomerase-1
MVSVVIVESPGKVQTINKYLGSDYEVVASYGHVRDLPAKDGSVDPEADFAMSWEVDDRAGKRVADIARRVKAADRLILATDPDREGEAISWHILKILEERKALKKGVPVQRVSFNAITKQAIDAAMAAPREIDQALVDAYLARRALDYLVGFSISPVLWRKLPSARSAGRVQSVALRLVVERELEIERFTPREYWTLVALLATARGETFEARLVGADGKKIGRLDVGTKAEADAFRAALDAGRFTVAQVEAKPAKRHPAPPFQTSTLQQEASRKLGLAPAITMRIAQQLYEGVPLAGEGSVGLITYMRTDAVQMSGEAVAGARRFIGSAFAPRYLPEKPRAYATKAKNAQEAHEAIRPTDMFRTPERLRGVLSGDDLALYDLIWKRTIASQMESAEFERTMADIAVEAGGRRLDLRANGQVVLFDGFLALYQEGKDDEEDEESRRLPPLAAGDALQRREIRATQSFTEPPPRYSEATLIKEMERLGIGRPSTYASTIAVLKDRNYISVEKKKLKAENSGILVTSFLAGFFARYVEYDFTAALENDLDRISNSEVDWREVMRAFWRDFSAAISGAMELRTAQVIDALDEALDGHLFPKAEGGRDPRLCPRCQTGRLGLRLAKNGPFIGCSNYPECRYTRQFGVPGEGEEAGADGVGSDGVRRLGPDPASGLEVTAREGRFGPFVQLGEGEKPRRTSIPKPYTLNAITLEEALKLLMLPREVGPHPEDGEPIIANLGRYGPYVQHGKTYANLAEIEDLFTIGLNRAVDVIAEKRNKGPGGFRRGAAAASGKPLGEHPDGGPVTLHEGRYGPYVKWGSVNATIPKGADPASLDLEAALALVAARQAVTGPAKGRGAKSKPAATRTKAADAAANGATPARPNAAAKGAKAKTTATKGAGKADASPAKASAAKPAGKGALAKGASAKSRAKDPPF